MSNTLYNEREDINKVSTNKAQGIDAIVIIINDRLISDESDLAQIGENEKLIVKLCFIQSTTQSSFNLQKFQSFIDGVVNFLTNQLRIEPFSDIYDKLFDEEGDYIDNLKETPKLSLFFVSGCTRHNLDNNTIEKEKQKILNRNEINKKFDLENIYFFQTKELNEKYDQIPKFHTVSLKLHKNVQLDEKDKVKISLLSAIKFKEFKKLILTKEENLRDNLFVDNPRLYIGETPVNEDIKSTLSNNNYNPYFIYLNNGLTIMCDSIKRHSYNENEYVLSYPRIINGCQTTHILYEHHKENPKSLENLEIVVKVIATEDNDLKKQIIFAANNQNAIDKDLQSLNEFHEKIEQFFQGNDDLKLFYERLRGQYANVTPPYKKINIEALARIYISTFLKEPHKMKSNAIKKINEYQQNGKIFKHGNLENIADYYYCAILYYWLNKFVVNNVIILKSQTMDMHLLMSCNLTLEKDGKNTTQDKINYIKYETNAKITFEKVCLFIEKQRFLFERRGFYSSPKTKRLIEELNNASLN